MRSFDALANGYVRQYKIDVELGGEEYLTERKWSRKIN